MAPSPLEVAVRAAVAGNLRPIKKLSRTMDLRRGMGINGRSMLHLAAKAGVLKFCKFLVEEAGFDANSRSAQGETPILVATEADEDEVDIVPVLRYLLARGCDPAAPDNKGYTPLHNAAEFGHLEAVRLLLSKGVPVDPINRRGTPLHLAAAMDHDEVVKILLERGADPNRVANDVLSPLMMACRGHSLKCMKLLVEAGADVNFKSPSGRTILFQAVDDGMTDIVKFLLEAGADPNVDDGKGKIPIMIAAAREQHELVKLLLPQTKPIPSVPDWSVDRIIRAMKYLQSDPQVCQSISRASGHSPMKADSMDPSPFEAAIRAASEGNLHLLREMSNTMYLRDVRGFKGRNLLHVAAAAGQLDLCRFLVEESAIDANSTSAEGETAILVATGAMEDRTDNVVPVLRYLLDRGCDPAVPDDKGYTPLHNAAEYGHYEAVRVLLSKGVPVDPINRRGTPLHLAAAKGHDQAVKILLEHGADPNRIACRFLSPLAMACYGHSFKSMKLLVEAGADVNLKGPSGRPVLFNAVEEGLTDFVTFLLEAGADPNIHDGDGKFPIMLAAAHEQRELVNILLPRTKPIPSIPDWSIDGIIRTMKYLQLKPRGSETEQIVDAKSEGKEAFAKGDYVSAVYSFTLAIQIDPLDATLFSNRSLCWLRLGEGELALTDARQCTKLAPQWAKAWYREGAALSFLKMHKKAAEAFEEALKHDPSNDEIKKALREAMRSSARAR
ncbi:unnamed protein product [Urochloa decumbens]|uniref:Uncharacterized protein n=1 Tax=Urochloa decumbens TaxID=240449 RepID=A0ABC8VWH2_9POAL